MVIGGHCHGQGGGDFWFNRSGEFGVASRYAAFCGCMFECSVGKTKPLAMLTQCSCGFGVPKHKPLAGAMWFSIVG